MRISVNKLKHNTSKMNKYRNNKILDLEKKVEKN
jgi:hypothetical protein